MSPGGGSAWRVFLNLPEMFLWICNLQLRRDVGRLHSSRSHRSNFYVALFVVVMVAVVEFIGCLWSEKVMLLTDSYTHCSNNSDFFTVTLVPAHAGVLTWCSFPRPPSHRGLARRCARSSACQRGRRGSARWARGSASSSSQTLFDGSAPSTAMTRARLEWGSTGGADVQCYLGAIRHHAHFVS